MSIVKSTQNVDANSIIEFYKSEIESENSIYCLEAIRRYGVVSQVIGSEKSRKHLVPIILKLVETASDEVCHAIAEELIKIVENIGDDKHWHLLQPLCDKLLFHDETSIRSEAIRTFEYIFSKVDEKQKIKNFVQGTLLPIVKMRIVIDNDCYSVDDSSLSTKLSLCYMLPSLILPYCENDEKSRILIMYLSLCEDEVPSLRIGASQNLVLLLRHLFPVKYGLSAAEYDSEKLHNQDIITEKLLNLIVSLYRDETSSDMLRSTSIGIAVQLFINPVYFNEYISNADRQNLLYLIGNALEDRCCYNLRQTVTNAMNHICLALKGYYDTIPTVSNREFAGYKNTESNNILDNIIGIPHNIDIIQSASYILMNDSDIEIRRSILDSIEQLLYMRIDMNSRATEALDNTINSIIKHFKMALPLPLYNDPNVSIRCAICRITVAAIKYLELYYYKDIPKDEFEREKLNLTKNYIHLLKDSNNEVIITAVERLQAIIVFISKDVIVKDILPQIKLIFFNSNINTSVVPDKGNIEETVTLLPWRVKRAIIKQLPFWFRSLKTRITPFFDAMIICGILDPTHTLNVCAMQAFTLIIDALTDFSDAVSWIETFILQCVIYPYLRRARNSIQINYDIFSGSLEFDNYKNPRQSKDSCERCESFEYEFSQNNYLHRILILQLIYLVYRGLIFKMVKQYKLNEIYLSEVKEELKFSMELCEKFNNEHIYERISNEFVPIILQGLEDQIINVQITSAKVTAQILDLFSIDQYKTQSFGLETCKPSSISSNDETLRQHLYNQHEFDTIWHLRAIQMPNNSLPNPDKVPNYINSIFTPIFRKCSQLADSCDSLEYDLYYSLYIIRSYYISLSSSTLH
ncbi:HEAT repeat family protein [Cryptosporidium muris RN66]|uniref:HEAT repeat family protein n=1 Tax=Cryptosporidium muris (strain RN66) TaxID=441375 RepID=B6ACY1_CRYMR|nr:HEAT repeat family protein [Cryptosporidium muris RN66]EEA05985.1 HEAT repeat family protein [Cryptosporidium muris RN66]|eukprot:XP_002140334.1 HEAT repeat family protein [Cryptosporidium muris RN66]